MRSSDEIRGQILELAEKYHAQAFAPKPFVPGQSAIRPSGAVFDADEMKGILNVGLDFWLTAGRCTAELEKKLGEFVGANHVRLVNSGSSACLLAVATLTAPELGERRLMPGDEVITVACGFPTTVAPIVQVGCVPVFVDITVPTYNIDVEMLEAALSPRTKAIVVAHMLGNPFDIWPVRTFAWDHNLWLIEDCCDALGSTYRGIKCGTFGDLATLSFFPAHHITTGEGGAVLANTLAMDMLAASFRDWGRDCHCDPGTDGACGKRFEQKWGTLPYGFDHKYVYSHLGYNLRMTEMQAAIGVAQMDKLPGFIEKRRANFKQLSAGLEDLREFFVLPEATPGSDPSWFGFPIGLRWDEFTRDELTGYLESRKIGTRMMFGGNLTRHPAFAGTQYRIVGNLANSDWAMNNAFWIGLWPGLSEDMIQYVVEEIHRFCRRAKA